MTQVEVELVGALFAIYTSDCIYWAGPADTVFTRLSSSTWKPHCIVPLSFTLLGKKPLLADPFLLMPGFLRCRTEALPTTPASERILRKVSASLNKLWLLESQCRIQALLLLGFVPWVIWTGRLASLWRPLIGELMLSHILLMVSFMLALRKNRIARPLAVAAPLLFNPLGAVRLLDLLSQSLFDRLLAAKSRRSAVAGDCP